MSREARLRIMHVPDLGPRAHMRGYGDHDRDFGRLRVDVDQPDGWTCTVEILKNPGERPLVAKLTIQPTEWILEQDRYAEDPESVSILDDPHYVPGSGLTRSAVQRMSWEAWRQPVEEYLRSIDADELRARSLELLDVQAIAPRKPGSRGRRTDVEKAQIAAVYEAAVDTGANTAKAVQDHIFDTTGKAVSDKTVRNLIAQLRKEEFLTETEGRKPGGRITQKTIDLLEQQRETTKGGK